MGNLNQVVELHTLAYIGATHGRAIDASIGTYLHIVFDGDDTNLWNLVVTIRTWSESESIGTDDTSRMQGDIIAETATMVDTYVRVDESILANLDTFSYISVRINLASFTHLGTIGDVCEGTHIDILSHLCLRRNKGERVDARFLRFHRLVHLEQLSHALVGVLHTNQSGAYWLLQLYGLVDQDHTRLSVVNIMGVFRVRKERNCPFLTFFNLSEGVDFSVLITFHFALNELGNLLSGKFHIYLFFLILS